MRTILLSFLVCAACAAQPIDPMPALNAIEAKAKREATDYACTWLLSLKITVPEAVKLGPDPRESERIAAQSLAHVRDVMQRAKKAQADLRAHPTDARARAAALDCVRGNGSYIVEHLAPASLETAGRTVDE